ncbi:hypothetical protein NHP190012_13770 [Helicobacter sp. NHP19-012]|uniref:Uncharacterized protein n=1 Tax=Helicobacter gastrofelis TaxID=2849642 RepID=A0ABN6IDE5_9HELI|nr:hypothetical protein [Helicobacter sp. NHP19-012]BCZ19735.1 hypothetical protein NHP190012_13770 [Helicobacter sp. NHP19-012]
MKLAKFALSCDGVKVTSLEQLKEHFNLLDILEHYKSGTLSRWLRSRGYENELQGIEAINATEDAEILNALCGVFGIEADLETISAILEEHAQEQERAKAEVKAQSLIPLAPKEQALIPTITQNALVTPLTRKPQRSLAKH